MINKLIFRAYDIRGVVEKHLSPEVVERIGRAIATTALAQNQQTIIVARDGRLSGPELKDALVSGIISCGVDVIDIGAVPTPLLYFATNELGFQSGGHVNR